MEKEEVIDLMRNNLLIINGGSVRSYSLAIEVYQQKGVSFGI